MRALIPSTVFAERCPDVLRRSRYSLLDAADAVECRTDIERENGRTVRLRRGGVVVNHIANFFTAAPANYPVMAVEGRFGATRTVS